jgi:dynein assembly factor with WDR repeat domains 1
MNIYIYVLRTVKLWDLGSGMCVETLRGHTDEVLSVSYNTQGSKIVSASADGTACIHNVSTAKLQHQLQGHVGECSQALFNPQGDKVLTLGVDSTARI